MPTAPPAPARLLITTGCLRNFSIATAVGRPVWSATPPGGNGTIIVIGRSGNPCAGAPPAAARTTSAAIAPRSVDLGIADLLPGRRVDRARRGRVATGAAAGQMETPPRAGLLGRVLAGAERDVAQLRILEEGRVLGAQLRRRVVIEEGQRAVARAARHRQRLVHQRAGEDHRAAGRGAVRALVVLGKAQVAAVILVGVEVDRDREAAMRGALGGVVAVRAE